MDYNSPKKSSLSKSNKYDRQRGRDAKQCRKYQDYTTLILRKIQSKGQQEEKNIVEETEVNQQIKIETYKNHNLETQDESTISANKKVQSSK